MTSRDRMWATIVMWVVGTTLIGVLLTEAPATIITPGNVPLILGMVLTALAAATWAVWVRAGGAPEEQQEVAAKVKRADPRRVERLIEALDEDEIVELETLLLAREDDSVRGARQ